MLHQAPLREAPGRARHRIAVTVATIAMVASALTGCSSDDPDDAAGNGGASGQGGTRQGSAEAVATVVVPGKRAGWLPKKQHAKVARRVASVVDGWWDAAFVEADYPRRRYQGSFPGFTRPAAGQAWKQRDLMTSARLGRRIDDLVPLRRRVAVDVLATGRVARAATARVRMDYRTRGEVEKRIRVQGRLLMTFDRGWKVFGFDVTQGPIVPATSPQRGKGKSKGSRR